jgi:hypothetical protein
MSSENENPLSSAELLMRFADAIASIAEARKKCDLEKKNAEKTRLSRAAVIRRDYENEVNQLINQRDNLLSENSKKREQELAVIDKEQEDTNEANKRLDKQIQDEKENLLSQNSRELGQKLVALNKEQEDTNEENKRLDVQIRVEKGTLHGYESELEKLKNEIEAIRGMGFFPAWIFALKLAWNPIRDRIKYFVENNTWFGYIFLLLFILYCILVIMCMCIYIIDGSNILSSIISLVISVILFFVATRYGGVMLGCMFILMVEFILPFIFASIHAIHFVFFGGRNKKIEELTRYCEKKEASIKHSEERICSLQNELQDKLSNAASVNASCENRKKKCSEFFYEEENRIKNDFEQKKEEASIKLKERICSLQNKKKECNEFFYEKENRIKNDFEQKKKKADEKKVKMSAENEEWKCEADRQYDKQHKKTVANIVATLQSLSEKTLSRQPSVMLKQNGLSWVAPPSGPIPPALIVGEINISNPDIPIPVLVPFPPQKAHLFKHDARIEAFLSTFFLRFLTTLPAGMVRVLVCDPLNQGKSLGPFLRLLDAKELFAIKPISTREEIQGALDAERRILEERQHTFLRDVDWFQYNETTGKDAPLDFRILLLFDMPERYTQQSLDSIESLIFNGPQNGILPVLFIRKPSEDDRTFEKWFVKQENKLDFGGFSPWASALQTAFQNKGLKCPDNLISLRSVCPVEIPSLREILDAIISRYN